MSRKASPELAAASAPGDHPGPRPGYDLGQNFTSALAIGLAALLCTFALLAFYFCRHVSLGHQQQQQRQQQQNENQGGDHQESLDDIPVFDTPEELRNREGELKTIVVRGGESCAVCLGDFRGDLAQENPGTDNASPKSLRIRLLPRCGHYFHCDCVDEWLRAHQLCPICRTGLRSPPVSSKSSINPAGLVLSAPVVRVAEEHPVQLVVLGDDAESGARAPGEGEDQMMHGGATHHNK